MTVEEIENSVALPKALRAQARALLAVQGADPRAAGIFATQQRWLLAHIALRMCFESRTTGQPDDSRLTQYFASVAAHGVASRNTADAFIKEMLKYGFMEAAGGSNDRRMRPLAASEISIRLIDMWMRIHLATLDGLDGGDRSPRYAARPDALARIHPRVAVGLLRTEAVREPAPTFSLFTWVNEGGILMDWLYAGLEDFTPGAELVRSEVRGYADFSQCVRLSKSHLARKLRGAESMRSLVWEGARGASRLFVSMRFVREYQAQQSAKLAVIDDAVAYAGDHGFV